MLGNFKEPGNFVAFHSFIDTVFKKIKIKITFFQDFSGISAPSALFKDKSFTMFFTNSSELFKDKSFTIFFTNSSETSFRENVLVIL